MMKIDDENQNLKSIKEEEEEEDKESKTNEEQEKEQIPAFYYGDFKIE